MSASSGAFSILRKSSQFPRVADDPAISRAFNRINAIQWIAIAAVAFAFNRLHLNAYAISVILAIVGLHLYPLARLFRYPLHYVTACLLVVWASASCLIAPVEQLQAYGAMGAGILLWMSALASLAWAHLAASPSRLGQVATAKSGS